MEEVFDKTKADELEQRIADRLGKRQEKLEQMESWEKPARTAKIRPLYMVLAAAACIVAVVLMRPLWTTAPSPLDELGIEAPQFSDFRAASPEVKKIEQMMEEGKYEEALVRIRKSLELSDWTLAELAGVADAWDSEEMEYEEEMDRLENSELRWTYIYLLIKTGDTKEARKQLKIYLKDRTHCEHREEAKELLEKLKN